MAKSKWDESLLTPIDEQNQPLKKNKSSFNESLLTPIEEEDEFLPPKEENHPLRSIAIGLAKLGHSTQNMPYDLVKNLENQGLNIGAMINKSFPEPRNPNQSPNVDEVAEFNRKNNVPESLQNPLYNQPFAEKIPHQQNYDFAQMLGQTNEPGMIDKLIQKGVEYAPEIYGAGKLLTHLTPQRIKDIFGHGQLNKESENLKSSIDAAQNKLKEIESNATEAENKAGMMQNESNESIANYLNKGAAHSVRGASSLSHRLNNIENYWKGSYKNLKNELKSSQFQMEDLPQYGDELKYTLQNIKDAEFVNGRLVIKGQPEVSSELSSIINKAPTAKDVSADEFLTKYQDFRDARYDLLQRAKDAPTASERKALFKAHEDSKPLEETVSKALHEGLGPHKSEFQRINSGYSTQIYPLRANKVARQALSGKLGPNALSNLEGSGEGQELMREIVKQDPELLRNMVGQRYAAKPQSLHDINETTAEYLHEMPQLKKIMDEHTSLINKQLEHVSKLKNEKSISLKQKIDLENQYKQLKDKLLRVKRDRNKIWGTTKKAVKYGAAAYLGGNIINKLIGK